MVLVEAVDKLPFPPITFIWNLCDTDFAPFNKVVVVAMVVVVVVVVVGGGVG